MSEKSPLNLSLEGILSLNQDDLASLDREDVVRDVKLQFSAAHADVHKRINKAKKDLKDVFMNMENFDINRMIEAECALENQNIILKVVENRYSVLFPESKLDIL